MINPSSSQTQRSMGPVTGHRTSNLLSLLEDRPSRKGSKNRRPPSGDLQISRSSSPIPSQLKIFRQLTNMDTNTAIRRERQKFKIFSTLSLAGQIYMGIVSLYVFAVYLAQTYIELPGQKSDNVGLQIAEYIALALIVFDLINQIFFISESNLRAMFSLTTAFDILTITMLALQLRPCTGFSRLIQFNKFVQFARTWRLIYKNSQSQSFKLSQQLITTQFVVVVIEVISFFMMASALFLVLNRHFPEDFAISSPDGSPSYFTVISSLYFTLITVTTLGYGDYYPNAPWNRMLDCFFFITAVVWLTLVTQKISQLYAQRGKYLSRYRIHTKRIKHVVVAGRYLSSLKLRGFLRQFFHPDHGSIKDTKSVIILDQKPDSELLDVINEYAQNTHIILGDFFDDSILEKAQIKKAEAVFLLSSARQNMTQNADMFVVLASHKANLVKSTMRINAQINSKNFMMHNWCGWSNVYSIQQFKMGILAANAFNPGFCPMILNLLRSSSKYAFKEQKPWLLEYNQGLEHEIYLIPGRVCEGVKFSELVKNAYNSRGALVIGVKNREERSHTLRRNAVQNSAIEDRKNVWLNPMDHKIQGTDQIIVLAKDSIHARTAVEPQNWRFMSGAQDFGSFQNKVMLKTSTKSAGSQKKKGSRFAPYSDQNGRRSTKGNLFNQKDDLEDEDESPVAKKSISLDDLKFSKNYDYKLPKKLPNQYFPIWKSYVKNLRNHILVFGEVEAAVSLIDILCLFTSNFICYVSDRPMDQAWEQLMSNKPPNILYFECSFSNPKELKKTGIESAQHVIVLSWMLEGSNSHDSGMLQIVRTIEQFFPQVKYTLELVDEANIKFIGCHKEDLKLPLTCKSNFASGKLLYTSTLEAIVAQVNSFLLINQIYYNDSILSIMNKIIFADLRNSSHFQRNHFQNSKLNFISIKEGHQMPIIKYKDIFMVLIEEGVIPIALYRDIDGYLENNERYIVTNPDPEIVILKDDIILVLGDTVDSKKKRLRAQTKSVNINFMKKLSQQLTYQQEPQNEDKQEVEPEGSPAASPIHSDSLHPEIVTLEQIQPLDKEEEDVAVLDRSESMEIPQEITDNSMSKVQLSSNIPALGLEYSNISRIQASGLGGGGGHLTMLGQEFKQRAASMNQLPIVKKNIDEVNCDSDESDYQQLDDETILLLISEQLKHSTRDRSLLKEQEQMLQKLRKGRVLQRVKQFVDNLKRAVQRARLKSKIPEEEQSVSYVEEPAPSDSMSQARSNALPRRSVVKDKPRGLDSAKRRGDDRNISHNADVSVPSVPPRPLSLVRRLQQEEPPKSGSFERDLHFHSMLEPASQLSFLGISNERGKPNARTKSTQIQSKTRT